MNENETSKDIIAEMRTKAECAKPYDDGIVMMLTDYADRFEAALKREQSQSWHHREMEELVLRHEKELVDAKKSSGDAAKLREALGKILWCLEWMFNNTDDKSVQSHLGKPIALAKAALAAPPRNCDVPYNGRLEMYYAFKGWCNARGHTMEPRLASYAFDWLLAIATDEKGGAS